MEMNWDYIAGYADGESCILLAIQHDSRESNRRTSQIDGWNISPSWQISSYDYAALNEIEYFLKEEGFDVRTPNLERQVRTGHTKVAKRLSIGGWEQLERLALELLPRSIVKMAQFELLLELKTIVNSKPLGEKKWGPGGIWTKPLFLKAMEKADEINSLKSRQRGKYNTQFFIKLWEEETGTDARS